MDKLARAGSAGSEGEVPTDLLASLLIEQASQASCGKGQAGGLTAKVYAVMTVTSLLTFATLVSAYRLLFSHHLFA